MLDPDFMTPFLRIPELMVIASVDRATRLAYKSPDGKLRVAHVTIDEFEESGVRILTSVDIAKLEKVTVVGAAMDLVPVLNQISGMTCSDVWHVNEVSIVEEEAADENLDAVMYSRSITNCVGALARGCREFRVLKLHMLTELDLASLIGMVDAIGWSQGLVSMSVCFQGDSPSNISSFKQRLLALPGWRMSESTHPLIGERNLPTPLPDDIIAQGIKIGARLAHCQQAVQRRITTTHNAEETRNLLAIISGLVDALADQTRGAEDADDDTDLRELEAELLWVLEEQQPTREVTQQLRQMFGTS